MSFLGPVFLWALPLVAIPIAIHLLHRRKQDVIRWGAMQFLIEGQSRRRKFWRLDDLLLMLLRAGLVLVLVLALARPIVRTSLLGSGSQREIVLVLDVSLSTARKTGDASTFDRLLEEADKFVANCGSSDSVRVMLGATTPQWLVSDPVTADAAGRRQLRAQIAQLKPSLATADLYSCVRQATEVEALATTESRLVVVLTDGQAQGWRADAIAAWQSLSNASKNSSLPTVVNVLNIGPGDVPARNLSIDSLETNRVLAGVGEEFSMTAHVRNSGSVALEPSVLEWTVNRQPLGISSIDALEPGQSVTIALEHVLEERGLYRLACQTTCRDDMSLDNEAVLIMETTDRVPILIVRSDDDADPQRGDTRFLLAALGRGKETAKSAGNDSTKDGTQEDAKRSLFDPTVVRVAELDAVRLSTFRCVLFTSLPELSEGFAQKLTEFVHAGGGVWLALGESTDAVSFNRAFCRDGEGLSPVMIGEMAGNADSREEFVTIHPPAAEHPATMLLGDTQRLDIDEARIHRRFRLAPTAAVEQLSVLLESGYGEPIAVEKFTGRGRVIVQGFPLGLQWSNLPLCHVFVPMVHEWLWYLIQPSATPRNLEPNMPIAQRVSETNGDGPAVLETPDGTKLELRPSSEGDAEVYRFTQTAFPGEYSLEFSPSDAPPSRFPFYVRREAAESDLTPLTTAQQTELAKHSPMHFVTDPLAWPADFRVVPRRTPVWTPLLVLVVMFLSLELAWIGWTTWRRFVAGTAVVPYRVEP